jgi:glycosyltransferase involved in cell wall biosynthesis
MNEHRQAHARMGDGERGPAHPRVSVVIVTHDDLDNLVGCLQSLAEQDYPAVATEVVVVDDGSTDGTADVLRNEFPGMRVISKPNEGADVSRNRGIEESTGEIIAFIDSDCTAFPDWLARMTERLIDEPNTMIGGRVLHRGSFWQRLTGIADFGEYQGLQLKEVRAIPTCNMGLTRTVLGGVRFDPRLARAGGDTLFAETLRRKGAKLIYDPGVAVVHWPSVEMKDLLDRAKRYGRSFVEARKIEPSMRYAAFVRAGVPGVIAATLGRTLLDWQRLLRHRRAAGFGLLEVPAGMLVLLLRRLVSLPEAVRALRASDDG